MSSMRNAVQRRNHRERGQPEERAQKWGLLEKHKVCLLPFSLIYLYLQPAGLLRPC